MFEECMKDYFEKSSGGEKLIAQICNCIDCTEPHPGTSVTVHDIGCNKRETWIAPWVKLTKYTVIHLVFNVIKGIEGHIYLEFSNDRKNFIDTNVIFVDHYKDNAIMEFNTLHRYVRIRYQNHKVPTFKALRITASLHKH